VSLKHKFALLLGTAALGLLALASMWLYTERSDLLAERLQKTRSLIEIPYSIITQQQELEAQGKLTRAEAQQRALKAIRALRYEGNNYFWINDLHPTMVLHPMKPELEGKDLTDFKDPAGKALFVDMVAVSLAPEGGSLRYLWPKPGKDKPVPKLSFVRRFPAWGWVIGTGIYIDDVEASWRASAMKAAISGLGCLLLLLGISRSVWRSIFLPLHLMELHLRDVAQGEGDLTKRLEVSRHDEIGTVSQWFNTFMDRLHETISQVASNTESLAAAGQQISASSRQQARGAEEQKDQTAQAATAMQEMAATVQEVSENSGRAATASQKAAETAREGGRVVEETLARMRDIAQSVGDAARKVQELGKRSNEIGRIVGVIDDIADQTNLLALNAAIEAARAGEQGRGFAVVADEVGKLAERTRTATKEIAGMIGAIQSETRSVVETMQAGTRQVELGVESTSQAGCSLEEIIEVTGQVGEMIAHIATAATEQATATEQVNKSVDHIAKIATAGVLATQQSAQALENLSGLALSLKSVVGQFRLKPGDRAPGAAARRAAAGAL